MYQATLTQAKANSTTVTDRLIFHSCPFYALIDLGATHCFIASHIMKRLGLEFAAILQISREILDGNKIHNIHILIEEIVSLES